MFNLLKNMVVFLIYVVLTTPLSFAQYSYEYENLPEVFQKNCFACRTFSNFYDTISIASYPMYEHFTKNLLIFLFFGMAFWILKHTYDELIKKSITKLGGGDTFDGTEYWKEFMKKVFKISLVLGTVFSINLVHPKNIFRYTLDPIIQTGIEAGKYVTYTQNDIFYKEKMKKNQETGVVEYSNKTIKTPEYCKNSGLNGNYADVAKYPSRTLLNKNLKLDLMCLIKGYDILGNRLTFLDYTFENMTYKYKFINPSHSVIFKTLKIFFAVIVIFLFYSLRFSEGFIFIIFGGTILSLFLIFFTTFSITVMAILYLAMSFLAKLLTSFIIVGSFIKLAVIYFAFPLLAIAWVFDQTNNYITTAFEKVIETSIGFFTLSLAFLIGILFNDALNEGIFDKESLQSLALALQNGDAAAISAGGQIHLFLISLFGQLLVCMLLVKYEAIQKMFGIGSSDKGLWDSISGLAKKGYSRATSIAKKAGKTRQAIKDSKK